MKKLDEDMEVLMLIDGCLRLIIGYASMSVKNPILENRI